MTDLRHADRFNHAVLEAQQHLLSEQKPAAAQSLNAVLNLPVDSAARLYDIITGDGQLRLPEKSNLQPMNR